MRNTPARIKPAYQLIDSGPFPNPADTGDTFLWRTEYRHRCINILPVYGGSTFTHLLKISVGTIVLGTITERRLLANRFKVMEHRRAVFLAHTFGRFTDMSEEKRGYIVGLGVMTGTGERGTIVGDMREEPRHRINR